MAVLDWLDQKAWVLELAIALAVLIGVNFLFSWWVARSKHRAHHHEEDWRCHLDRVVLPPFRLLLTVVLVAFLVDLMVRHIGFKFPPVGPWRDAAIILCVAWLLLRWVHQLEGLAHRKKHHGAGILSKVATVVVLFVAVLLVLQSFGFDIAPLLTFGGIGAAVVGIASKDVVANFFGGMMIYMTRPFTVGDLIEIPEKEMTGYIDEIGWYYTSIFDLQKKPVYLPNSLFSTEVLVNHSRITHRAIEEKIQLRMVDVARVEAIVADIRKYLAGHPAIDAQAHLLVGLSTFAAYSADLEIKAYSVITRLEEFVVFKQRVLLEIYAIVKRHGGDLPNPTMTVEMQA